MFMKLIVKECYSYAHLYMTYIILYHELVELTDGNLYISCHKLKLLFPAYMTTNVFIYLSDCGLLKPTTQDENCNVR